MKNLLFLLAIVVMLASCDEETQDVINNPSSIVPGIEAKVGGADWKADVFAGVQIDTANVLTISASRNSDNSIMSIVIQDPQVKTYTVGDSTAGAIVTYTVSGGARFGVSGQVNITNFGNSLVSGTFNVTSDTLLGDPVEITDGVITNVPVTVQ